MQMHTVQSYAKLGDALEVPDLVEVQSAAYERFLQQEEPHDQRDTTIGLESLLREVFPIPSYDSKPIVVSR
jgi:DNA-directed RNA polymerase beta subunit